MIYRDATGNEFEIELWCNKYNANCNDVPEDVECHKCCSSCTESE